MKYLSLFSGIGGFELGIQQAYEDIISNPKQVSKQESLSEGENNMLLTSEGDRKDWNEHPTCIGYSEIDKYAIQVYEKHFKHKNYGDCTKIITSELPDFDLLVGGFPCQAFSIAGKRRGFDEARGTLFFDIARILADKKPRNFILENVKGLLSHDSGRTFTTIIRILSTMGYFVEWQVLNAKNFGVPQNRERVFIVGHLGGQPRRKVFPITKGDGLDIQQTEELPMQISNTIRTNYSNGFSNETYIQSNESGLQEIRDFTNNTDSRGGQTYPTDIRIRRLTPKECERLMGYPDDWTLEGTQGKISDTQRYKMCGNGIVSNVVKEVVSRLSFSNKYY
jgi:DNA (cytosine-5)-methyltransferase 1